MGCLPGAESAKHAAHAMNARQRVQAALRHQRPDRIPRYEIFLPEFSERWRAERRRAADASIYDDYPKIDIGTVLATQVGPFTKQMHQEEHGDEVVKRDSWGRLIRERKGAKFFEVLETAVRDKADLDRLALENPADPDRTDLDAVAARERQIRERFAPVSGVMGLFMSSYALRGEVPFLMDLMEDESFCHALIGRVADFIAAQGALVARRTNTLDTALWVYDDFSSQQGPLISPATFEKFFVPPYQRMIRHWKSQGVQNVILHHDGNCGPVLDLIVAAGFTGIQGIYPGAGLSIPAVKARYGRKLCLIGGVCNITVLAGGTRRDIERHVAGIVEAAQDGGVIIGAHSIDEDIPVAQYDAYYAAVTNHDATWETRTRRGEKRTEKKS